MKTSVQKQNVTIKGTKDGIIIHLNDQCGYDAMITELKSKLTENHSAFDPNKDVSVRVHLGKRYLEQEQQREIQQIIEESGAIVVDELISEVMTKKEAKKQQEQQELTTFTRLVRSGQVLRVKGDLLILGDVNPGGAVEAAGDVYVLGALKGIARAGIDGNENAIVAASVMVPSQITIADRLYLTEATRAERSIEMKKTEPKYACIEHQEEDIVFHAMSGLAAFRRDRKNEMD
ncbi:MULTISPECIES: septum site-determining protein MinC [Geomicrobium]|uniref:Probable septum site-determining protein MinC n=1 Tax=Geomicrobium sediminis TaxID=1347788 RepID=A0ABS2P8E6_9BACL|nr:septum site-determining protein MinC [Geomicrobium sp. JCM 19038]MBM7631665.1 septum site-determining protein MinC [Geomicrobium sediminis]GAK09284.1 septum site-determining protein MinC [Geomicrobium sp. JCM 19038]